MMPETRISIAQHFTKTPGPRYVRQGKFSGEEFRRRYLERAFNEFECVVVDLDGTMGYGSSFLDEAFGGLIRDGILSPSSVRKRLKIRSNADPSYEVEAWSSIEKARKSN